MGVLVFIAILLIIGFVIAMGGLRLEKHYTLFVDFDSPGWLTTGAMVKVSGVEAGKVKSIAFVGGEYDPVAKHRVYVRLELRIAEKFKKFIHEDAQFFVSSQGVLGEQYIEIIPGTYEKPYLEDGSVVMGVNPPRLELALAKGYTIIETLEKIVSSNRPAIESAIMSIRGILETTDTTLKEHRGDISDVIMNIKETSNEAKLLVAGARKKYVDNPKIDRIIANAESITHKVDQNAEPILKSARTTLDGVGNIAGNIDKTDIEEIKSAIKHISLASNKVDNIMGKVQKIVDRVEKGEGNIGALLKDEELFDDLREMVRDLKHNPWKMFWKN